MISNFSQQTDNEKVKYTIFNWIDRIHKDWTEKSALKAFYFGLIETTEGYEIYLIGSNNYDSNDDDWACDVDYEPVEKYLQLPPFPNDDDWQVLQKLVVNIISEFTKQHDSDEKIFTNKVAVTVGFDGGNLVKIK